MLIYYMVYGERFPLIKAPLYAYMSFALEAAVTPAFICPIKLIVGLLCILRTLWKT